MVKNETINKAIEYIFTHINDKLTVDEIASYCNFSKYHFCRLFKEEMGESLYSFIKRNKIMRSATSLKAEKEKSITEIGLDCGYSASNYATAFKELLNQSPAQFRKERKHTNHVIQNPFMQQECRAFQTFEEYNEKISIVTLPDYYVYYQRFQGSYMELREHWKKFTMEYGNQKEEGGLFIERSFSDPDVVANEQCLCDLCMTVPKNSTLRPTTIIQGGKYAIYHFNDHRREIYGVYQGLTCVWLPASNYTLDQRNFFDIIRKADCEHEEFELDICIPIQSVK